MLFEDGDQQVNADSNPYLSLYAVDGSAEELLDSQMLFDPFEEQLNQPSLMIKVGNRESFDGEIVCQKDVVLVLIF